MAAIHRLTKISTGKYLNKIKTAVQADRIDSYLRPSAIKNSKSKMV
ncbi:MAG: hypothetical protein ACHBN1_28390 [Heteroscytonema crispum UTEX LB 1556]